MTSDRGSYRRLYAPNHASGELPRPEAVVDPAPAEGWVGWCWLGRRRGWQEVCRANSIGDCSRKLTVAAKERGVVKNTHQVMTRGAEPAGPPPSTRRGPLSC
jgi:hypothetical protein